MSLVRTSSDDSEDDEEPLTDDGALSIWPAEHTPQSDSPTGAANRPACAKTSPGHGPRPLSRSPRKGEPGLHRYRRLHPADPGDRMAGMGRFVHRAPASARDVTDGAWSQAEREDHHSVTRRHAHPGHGQRVHRPTQAAAPAPAAAGSSPARPRRVRPPR
jgi:hypothetical protein